MDQTKNEEPLEGQISFPEEHIFHGQIRTQVTFQTDECGECYYLMIMSFPIKTDGTLMAWSFYDKLSLDERKSIIIQYIKAPIFLSIEENKMFYSLYNCNKNILSEEYKSIPEETEEEYNNRAETNKTKACPSNEPI
jgi:hypothetical protein